MIGAEANVSRILLVQKIHKNIQTEKTFGYVWRESVWRLKKTKSTDP